jgi:hypothetical protein
MAVVTDGRPGVKSVFYNVPLQMCQFHQVQIVNRYLTKSPKLLPSQQLRTIVEDITKMNYRSFVSRFQYWLEIHENFINEQTINPDTGRRVFTHKKLRSAVHSLKNNQAFLFTYQRYNNLPIPNTTNSLDGWFAHLRKLLNCHNGLSKKRRNRVIQYILATQNFN